MTATPRLFEPFAFANGVELANRIIMAPMTTWSANDDGTVSDDEVAYYRRRANGVGLVLTGCTHVTPDGIGFAGEFAAWDDRFLPSLKRLAQAARSGGAPAVLQIFHAGNKAVPELVPSGEIVSASSLKAPAGPFNTGEVVTRALTADDILEIVSAFAAATRRAIEAGFDGVELHGAHGFLLQNFLSPLYNQREDEWGGSLENRMRFPLEVVREVKRTIAEHASRPFLLGYRISAEEQEPGGLRIGDAEDLIDRLVDGGIDYIHVSLPDLLATKPIGGADGRRIAERLAARVAGRIPVVAAGRIRTPGQAVDALDLGLSLVAVGQGLVINPDWVELARNGGGKRIETALRRTSVADIALPARLRGVIDATPGWFEIVDDEQREATA